MTAARVQIDVGPIGRIRALEVAVDSAVAGTVDLANNVIGTSGGLLTFTGNLGAGASLALLPATAGDAVSGTPGRVMSAAVMAPLLESIDIRFQDIRDTPFTGGGALSVSGSIVDQGVSLSLLTATTGDITVGATPNRAVMAEQLQPILAGKLAVSAKASLAEIVSGVSIPKYIDPYGLKVQLNNVVGAAVAGLVSSDAPATEALQIQIDDRVLTDLSNVDPVSNLNIQAYRTNRASGATASDHAYVAQVDGVDKAKFYGENSGSAVLAGTGITLRANPTSGLIEFRIGAGPWLRVKDDTPVSGDAALTAQEMLDLFGWELAAALVGLVFELQAPIGTFNGWKVQGSPVGQAVVMVTKGIDDEVDGLILGKGSSVVSLGSEDMGEVVIPARTTAGETVIASDLYVSGRVRSGIVPLTITNGGFVQVPANHQRYVTVITSPGTYIASGEIRLPTAPRNGDIVSIGIFGTIGALSVTSAAGAFVNAPSTITYQAPFSLQYYQPYNAWNPVA